MEDATTPIPKRYGSIGEKSSLFCLEMPPSSGQEKATSSTSADEREESSRTANRWITVLNPNDVLLGRGSGANDYSGNHLFRWLVEQSKDEYSRAKKAEKQEIARQVFHQVLGRGGRFLQVNTASSGPFGCVTYEVVDEPRAIKKCLHTLREKKHRLAAPPPDIIEQVR